jgi:tRNA isopentenyl-2-thiomethyl-A-37 hydroxylase MiaE
MWCKWEQRKTGRRVTHLIFTFGSRNQLAEKLKRVIKENKKKQEKYKKVMEKTGKPDFLEVKEKILDGETYGECERRLIGLYEEEKKINF